MNRVCFPISRRFRIRYLGMERQNSRTHLGLAVSVGGGNGRLLSCGHARVDDRPQHSIDGCDLEPRLDAATCNVRFALGISCHVVGHRYGGLRHPEMEGSRQPKAAGQQPAAFSGKAIESSPMWIDGIAAADRFPPPPTSAGSSFRGRVVLWDAASLLADSLTIWFVNSC